MKNSFSSKYLSNFSGVTLGDLPELPGITIREEKKEYKIKIFNVIGIEHYYNVEESYMFSKLYYKKHHLNNGEDIPYIEFTVDDIPSMIPEELHSGIKSLDSFWYKNKRVEVDNIIGKDVKEKIKDSSKSKLNKTSHSRADIAYQSNEENGRILEDKSINADNKMLSFTSVMRELEKYNIKSPSRYVTEITRPIFYKDAIGIEYLNGKEELKEDTFMFYLVTEEIEKSFNYHIENTKDDKGMHKLVAYIAAVFCYLNEGIGKPDEKTFWYYCLWVLKNYAFRKEEYYRGRTLDVLQRRIRRQVLDKYSWEEILKEAAKQEWNFIRKECMRFPKGMSIEDKRKSKEEIRREPSKGERTLIENIRKIVCRMRYYPNESMRELSKELEISKSSVQRAVDVIKSNKINYKNYKSKIKKMYPNLIGLE